MPELPEVETVVRALGALVPGRTVVDAEVLWPRSVRGDLASFRQSLQGAVAGRVGRRGKWLLLNMSRGTLCVHLRMSGRLYFCSEPQPPHLRVRLVWDRGEPLCFCDPRKFGRVFFSENWERDLPLLGIEPLDPGWSDEVFFQQLRGSKAKLKPFLLDQAKIAGIGNIYADEALWHSMLHPERRGATLSRREAQRLRRAIRAVLEEAIADRGTSLGAGEGNFCGIDKAKGKHQERLAVYQRAGLPCLRCATPIERIVVAQRSTHFCPRCTTKTVSKEIVSEF